MIAGEGATDALVVGGERPCCPGKRDIKSH